MSAVACNGSITCPAPGHVVRTYESQCHRPVGIYGPEPELGCREPKPHSIHEQEGK